MASSCSLITQHIQIYSNSIVIDIYAYHIISYQQMFTPKPWTMFFSAQIWPAPFGWGVPSCQNPGLHIGTCVQLWKRNSATETKWTKKVKVTFLFAPLPTKTLVASQLEIYHTKGVVRFIRINTEWMMLLLSCPLLFNLNLVECHSFPKINIFSGPVFREKTYQKRNIFCLFSATIGSHCSRPCFPYLARLDFLAISRRSPTNHGTTNVLVRKVSAPPEPYTAHPNPTAHYIQTLNTKHTAHCTHTAQYKHSPHTMQTTETLQSTHTLHAPRKLPT